MKTKIKLMALVAGLMSVLPMTSVWANSDVFYYAKATATVSSTGGGKVYASSTSVTSPDSQCTGATSTSGVGKSAANTKSVTLYRYAKADDGYEFKGWSTADNADISTVSDTSTSVTVTPSATSESGANNYTYYAYFSKKQLAAFSVTYLPAASGQGSYTVNGAAPPTDPVGNLTEVYAPKLVATPAANSAVKGWYTTTDGGATKEFFSTAASCTGNFLSSVSVGVEFVPVVPVTDCAGLKSALQTADAVSIASGVEIVIPAGETLTVSAGKLLVLDGKLMVIGSIVNNGSISGGGTIAYNAKTITQAAKVNVPYPAGTDGPAGTASGKVACDKDHKAEEVSSAGKYLNTSTSDGATELTGLSLTKKYFVTVVNKASGEMFTSSLLDSKPVAIVCTVARDKALNWISGMDGTVSSSYSSVKSALDKAQSTNGSGVANYPDGSNLMAVLTGNGGTVTYDGGGNTVTSFGTIVDLAGNSLTVKASNKTQYNRHCIVRVFNGSLTLSDKVMSTKFFLYNCTGSLGYLSGGNQYGTAAYLYDSPNYSVTFKDVVTDSPAGSLNFCGGGPYTTAKVKFQTTPTTKFNVVYAGTFVSGMNPTKYLWDDNKVEAVQDPSTKNWIVQDKYVDPNKGQTLVNGEEHSFVEAFEIAKAGDVIKLQRDVELEEDLNVASGKDVRLDLSGFALSGDFKIVNNGELEIIDGSNGVVPSQVNVQIVNNGTLLLSNAAYNGDITLNKGLCYFLAGSFNGDIIFAADAVANEVAQVRGGTFAKSVYKQGDGEGTLLSLCENGYTEGGKIAQIPNSYIVGPGTAKKASFSIRALPPDDEALVTRVSSYEENRSRYTKAEWIELMTVRASSSFFAAWNVDCGAKVDRAVEEGDLLLGISIYNEEVPAILAGDSASVLLPAMRDSGMASGAWSYSTILPSGENESKLSFSVLGIQAVEGTSVWMEMRLVRSVHILTQPRDWSYSGPYVVTGTRRFVVGAETNKAMVWGEDGGATFYSTLATAVAAAETNGKTIKLCSDCDEDVTVSKSCTIDLNGFDFTGSLVKGDGVEETVEGYVHTFVAMTPALPSVAKTGDVEYTDIYEAMEAAQDQKATLVLLDDVTADVKLTPDWSLNLNGHQVIGAIEVAEAYKADYWLKRSGDIYSVVPYVAQVGNAKYSSLANAINAAKRTLIPGQTLTVTLMTDCGEDVYLPEGIVLNKNGKNLTGAVTVPSGYAPTADGDTVKAELNYVAKIGSATYETLAAAVEAAAEGATIRVVKDCACESELTVAKECVIEAAKFAVPTLTAAAGYAKTVDNGTYTFTCTIVASVGDETFTSLLDAVRAVVEVQDGVVPENPTTICLRKDCDEIVVVDAPCAFTLNLGDNDRFAFSGMVIAARTVSVAKDGLTWTAVEVTDVPVQEAVVKVSEGLVEKVTEELEKKQESTPEAVQSALAEKISEAYEAQKTSAETGLAKVGTVVTTVGEQEKTLKTIKAEMKSGETVEQQESGIYQATKIITVDDEPVTVLDLEAKPQAVIKTVSKKTSLILAVPGDVKVDKVIKSGFEDGDTIVYYDGDTEYSWSYRVEGKKWVAIEDGPEAATFTLPAGSAIRYVRDESHTTPVVVVTDFDETKEIKVQVKADNWNVVANPNVEEKFDLDSIQPETAKVEAEDLKQDKIIVPLDDKTQRVYTYDGSNWGYDEVQTGYIGTIKIVKGKVRKTGTNGGNVKVDSGKGFWYYSGSASKPTIPWSRGKVK